MGGKILKTIFIIFILFFACKVFGYDNLRVHPLLSEAAAGIYNQQAGSKLTDQQKSWIARGSIDEDNDPRYLNHYYNPLTGKGLDAMDQIGKLKLKVQGGSAKKWAKSQSSSTGDYSESAILKNYQDGNLMRAYQGIGHILHLVQDMAVPAHTRNDSHAMGDPYEKWAEQYATINPSKLSFLNVSNLDQAFDSMAGYSNNNFFSIDSIGDGLLYNIKEFVREKDIDGNMAEYGYFNNYKLVKIIRGVDNNKYQLDFKVHLDYWNLLYPKAVGYSAGVIDYFAKQFEQIDKVKKEQEQVSWWQKLKNSLASLKSEAGYAWGDVYMTQRSALVSGYDNLVALITNTQNDFQNFSEANKEIIEQAANEVVSQTEKAGRVLSAFEQAGSAEEIFKPQPARAESAPENNKIPLTTLPTGQAGFIKGGEISFTPKVSGDEINSPNPALQRVIEIPPTQNVLEGEIQISPTPNVQAGNTAPTFIFVAGDSLPPETSITSAPGQITNSSSTAFIFASSESNSNFECSLNDADWQACGSPRDFSNLSDGNYIFKVRARDSSNNVDQTPAEHSWTIDTSAPQISITSGPPKIGSSTVANFQFASSESATAFTCQLDADSWQLCSASTTADNLIEGNHSLEIKGEDSSGNVSTSTAVTWLVDLTAPTSTVASLEAVYEATGFTVSWSGSDADATGATTTASGLADFDAQYKIDAGSWQDWINATTSTSTIFNLASASGQTIYFHVRATDASGNLGDWSNEPQTQINNHLAGHLVISEVQISGAVATDEFVELYNPTASNINLSGWRLTRKTASGATINNLLTSFPDKIILAHGYFLIAHPDDYDGAIIPDAVYSTAASITDSNTLILYSDAGQTIVDKVGFGSAGDYETSSFADNPAANEGLERKANAAATADSMANGSDKWQGNGYDSDNNSADVTLRILAEPQNSTSPDEPAGSTPILPGAISDLAAIQASTTASSLTLNWTSPENGKLNDNAYYEIKYQEKSGNCALQFNWDSAISVASSSLPVPRASAGAEERVEVTGLSANTEYCSAVRIYNGESWSNLSNQTSALTSKISQNKITVGNTSTSFSNWQSTFSWKHTVAGADPVLLVTLHTNGYYISSVSYGDQPMSLAVRRVYSQAYNNVAVFIYYLANPAAGTRNIEVKTSFTPPVIASAITFNNVDTGNPINSAKDFLESTTIISHSIATNYPNSMLLDAVTYNKPLSVSALPASGQTQYFSNQFSTQPNDFYSGESYKLAESAGSQIMSWQTADSRTSVHVVIGLNPKP